VFPLQRLGHEVMPVYTVVFSNHTGYGDWGGPMLKGDDVRSIVQGIDARGGLDDVELVLSGYQGGDDIGDAILDAVALVKQRNPEAVYACDPVLGSAASGCFVAPEVQSLIRDRVVPKADLITPNQFELGFLTGTDPHTLDETLASVDLVRSGGPGTVLVTSVLRPDRPEGTIEMLAVTADGAWIVQTPHLPFKANGSGDVTAALFSTHFRGSGDAADALSRTAASVFELLDRTHQSGARELQLIESQEAYVAPTPSFEVVRVR
jgi:pyridoxine kinase